LSEKVLKTLHRNGAEQQPHELPVRVVEATCEIDVHCSGGAVRHRPTDEALEMGLVLKRLEIVAIGDVDLGDRPVA
jgi:hypothetical protein